MTKLEERHGAVFASMPVSTNNPEWLELAINRGHDFCPDPYGMSVSEIRHALSVDPSGLSVSGRFTCRKCGDAALRVHKPYGKAFERDCVGLK